MFRLGNELRLYGRGLARLIYPAGCTTCHIPLFISETYLCRPCSETIETLKAPLCFKCASPLAPYGTRLSTCSGCRSERRYFDRGFAFVKYVDPVKTILQQVKFHQKPWLLKIFRERLRNFESLTQLRNYDVLVPVPLDRRRQLERGFNQAVMIARMLARTAGNGVPIRQMLKKRKRTLPQSQLKREERLLNLSGAFSLRKPGMARAKEVLLVDDIFTTGSTINECAKMLKEDGAERVDFLAIARS